MQQPIRPMRSRARSLMQSCAGAQHIKKATRVYNELGLQLRNKRTRRRVKAKLRDDRDEAVGLNDVHAALERSPALLHNSA
ncbi:MAG: hypothetical protein CFE33_20555 [Pseudorhodobacter sp. PARRP1]|nr:MAG: hypothetical protein CFE33_20555 [Pseudorhodobacter sp. PARRP1]